MNIWKEGAYIRNTGRRCFNTFYKAQQTVGRLMVVNSTHCRCQAGAQRCGCWST